MNVQRTSAYLVILTVILVSVLSRTLAQATQLPRDLTQLDWQEQGETLLALGSQYDGQWGLWAFDANLNIQRQISLDGYKVVKWSPDGARFSIDRDIIDATTFKVILTLEKAGSGIGYWSQDGSQVLAWANAEQTELGLFDSQTGELIRQILIKGRPDSISWSPNNAYLLLVQASGETEVISATDGHLISTLDTEFASGLSWSPDSQYLAGGITTSVTANTPGRLPDSASPRVASVVVWDALTGKTVRSFSPLPDFFRIVRWHPFKPIIVAGSPRSLIYVWDVQLGEQLEAFTLKEELRDLSFSPFGGRITASVFPVTNQQDQQLAQEQRGFPQGLYWSENFADNRLQTIVIDPSLEKLSEIESVCLPSSARSSLAIADILVDDADNSSLNTYIEVVQTDPAIPKGCAADLIAVAEALQDEQESR